MRENPSQVASQVTARVLYGDKHPYGYTETGTESSVKAITRDDLSAFWRQNFVANNAALVVAGDISMAELKALAEKSFGSWQQGTPARPVLTAPASIPPRVVIVDKPGAQTQLRVATIGDVDANLAKFTVSDRQIPIRVQLDEKARDDISVVSTLPVPTATGTTVPLSSIVEVRFGQGPSSIFGI